MSDDVAASDESSLDPQADATRTIEMPAAEHPNVVTGTTGIPGGPTRTWCEHIEREHGRGPHHESDHSRVDHGDAQVRHPDLHRFRDGREQALERELGDEHRERGRGEHRDLLLGVDLVNVRNDGIAFGLFGGGGTALTLITLTAVVLLVAYFAWHADRPYLWRPVGLLLVGALGTLAMLDTANKRSRTASDRQTATAVTRQIVEAAKSLPYREISDSTIVARLREDDSIAKVMELTDQRGADVAFEVIGLQATIDQAFTMTRRGGQAVLVGVPAMDVMMTVPVGLGLIFSEKQIRGCWYGSSDTHHDVPMLVELYQDGKLKLDELLAAHDR